MIILLGVYYGVGGITHTHIHAARPLVQLRFRTSTRFRTQSIKTKKADL